MNEILFTPDPPKHGHSFTICYWWDPANPGASVDLDVKVTFDDGHTDTQTITLTCPSAGNMACTGDLWPAGGSVTIDVSDQSGGALPATRFFVG